MVKKLTYPPALQQLITELTRLPGIGNRGAERLALSLMQGRGGEMKQLAAALMDVDSQLGTCPCCGFFSENGALCAACEDPQRDDSLLCVVEYPTDILPLERCDLFKGRYHCLGGKISPLDGVMPEDLRLASLLQRVEQQEGMEVILALSSDVEGEATALYIADLLEKKQCKVSRLAQGLPAGAGIGHSDTITIMRAFEGRQRLD